MCEFRSEIDDCWRKKKTKWIKVNERTKEWETASTTYATTEDKLKMRTKFEYLTSFSVCPLRRSRGDVILSAEHKNTCDAHFSLWLYFCFCFSLAPEWRKRFAWRSTMLIFKWQISLHQALLSFSRCVCNLCVFVFRVCGRTLAKHLPFDLMQIYFPYFHIGFDFVGSLFVMVTFGFAIFSNRIIRTTKHLQRGLFRGEMRNEQTNRIERRVYYMGAVSFQHC